MFLRSSASWRGDELTVCVLGGLLGEAVEVAWLVGDVRGGRREDRDGGRETVDSTTLINPFT